MSKRIIRALLVAGLTVASFVGAAAVAPSADAATRTFSLSINSVAKTHLQVGSNAVFSGKVTPVSKAKNTVVSLQVRKSTSKSWKTVKTITLNASAKFSNQAVKVSDAGTWYYRICNRASNGYKGACSASRKVVVTYPRVPAKYQGNGPRNKMTWNQYQTAINLADDKIAPFVHKPLEVQLQGVAQVVYATTKVSKLGQNLSHSGDPYGLLALNHYTAAGANRTVGLMLDLLGGIKWTYAKSHSQTLQWIIVTSGGKSYVVNGMTGVVAQVKNPKVYPSSSSLHRDGTMWRGPGL